MYNAYSRKCRLTLRGTKTTETNSAFVEIYVFRRQLWVFARRTVKVDKTRTERRQETCSTNSWYRLQSELMYSTRRQDVFRHWLGGEGGSSPWKISGPHPNNVKLTIDCGLDFKALRTSDTFVKILGHKFKIFLEVESIDPDAFGANLCFRFRSSASKVLVRSLHYITFSYAEHARACSCIHYTVTCRRWQKRQLLSV